MSFLENQCPYPCTGKDSYKVKDPAGKDSYKVKDP